MNTRIITLTLTLNQNMALNVRLNSVDLKVLNSVVSSTEYLEVAKF